MTADGHELSITRLIDAPPATVWRIWTERLDEWWAPRPWTTRVIENDLRPGGRTAMVMNGPGGETSPLEGGQAGYRSRPSWSAYSRFADEGSRTRYAARARHWDEATMKQHEAMGFADGWAAVAGQLAALCAGEPGY